MRQRNAKVCRAGAGPHAPEWCQQVLSSPPSQRYIGIAKTLHGEVAAKLAQQPAELHESSCSLCDYFGRQAKRTDEPAVRLHQCINYTDNQNWRHS